jgi:hypothetical protein
MVGNGKDALPKLGDFTDGYRRGSEIRIPSAGKETPS